MIGYQRRDGETFDDYALRLYDNAADYGLTVVRIAELLNADGIAHYTGADSFVQSGAFTTCGVNYTELGTKSADIAFDILMGGQIGEFVVMDGGIITVNTDTAAACGIDYSVFNSMANTVNAVTTVVD